MMYRLFLIPALSLLLLACNETRSESASNDPVLLPPEYYYYPKANVYFDSANKIYLFLGNDGATWQTAEQIPAVMQDMLDKSVRIDNPADTVWKDNNNHRLVYSAVLYATPSDTIAKKPVVKPVRKAIKPPIDSTVIATEVKEKRGIGKLIDRIFKRKKDKAQPDTTVRQ